MFHVKRHMQSVVPQGELFHVKPLAIGSGAQFAKYAAGRGWPLSPSQQQHIARLSRWLSERAPALGISKYSEPATVLSRAMAPALALSDLLDPGNIKQVVDLGAGSGALGLTLAILQPDWQMDLVERRAKIATFLELTVRHLGIDNVRVLPRDAAQIADCDRAGYDLVCFRALAAAEIALRLAYPLVNATGYVAAWHQPDDQGFRQPRLPLRQVATAKTGVPDLVVSLYERCTAG